MSYIIKAESTPVYDNGASFWGCNEWIDWHKSLFLKHGAQADNIWANAWLAGVSKFGGGNGTAPGSGYFSDSVPIDCRTYNENFRQYVKQRPILNDAAFPGISGLFGKVISSSVGTTKSVVGAVDGVASGAGNLANTLKWLLPLLAILAVLAMSFIVYKKYIDIKAS